MTDILVSVISVTHNNLEGLRRTGASVNSQCSERYEWLVVDGGSTDGTLEYLNSLSSPSVRWISEEDDGIYDAMNKGLQLASGEYCVFMNAGDVFASGSVLSTFEELSKDHDTHAPILFGDAIDCLPGAEEEFFRPARSTRILPWALFTQHQAMFFRTSVARQYGYDLGFRFAADFALVAKIQTSCEESAAYIPLTVCKYELGGANEQNRRVGIAEDYSIRRDVLGMSPTMNGIITLGQWVLFKFKRGFPVLFRWIRYGGWKA